MPDHFCSASENFFLAINFYKLYFSTIGLHQMTPILNVPSSLVKSKAHINDHLAAEVLKAYGKTSDSIAVEIALP